MIAKRIEGTTHIMGPPPGWNAERDGPCAVLPVRHDGHSCFSAWEPTPDELAALNAGGSVILRVLGGQPPVMLYVEPAKAEDGA